jgi:4-diphosphocytidyl-2C-methyl-D-erythritol kinase
VNSLSLEAQGKINLCLALGPLRDDGYHEVATVILPLDLADRLTIGEGEGSDLVVCPGVDGDNLAAKAVRLYREESGWDGPAVRIEIEKRIPVAAGMGGGSADAAAALRLIAAFAGEDDDGLLESIAPRLGADVPPLLAGGAVLASGTGERVRRVPQPASAGYLILPSTAGLSTPTVFAKAGEMGARREASAIAEISAALDFAAVAAGWELPEGLLGLNDLGPAAAALEPSVGEALITARQVGASQAFVSGSGPTVVALFPGDEGPQLARAAAAELAGRVPAAIACSASSGSATIKEIA